MADELLCRRKKLSFTGPKFNHMNGEIFRILIVDDDVDDHAFMKTGLDECKVKVQVDSVYDGSQAMDYLLRRNVYENIESIPDLVLLDLNMPRMDGFEILRQILKYPQLRAIPVYVITTSRNVDHLEEALALGAQGIYTKVSSPAEMVRIMREICADCFEEESAKPTKTPKYS